MKFIKSKILTTVMLLLTVIMYIFVLVLTVRTSQQTVDIRTPYMFLEGEYSIDDAEFKAFDPNEPINEPFKKIVFRGRFNKEKRAHFKEIAFTTKNMWYTMYTEDHEVICTNSYMTLDEWVQQYFEGSSEEEIAEKREDHIKYLRKAQPFKFNMPDTPGYSTEYIFVEDMIEAFPDPDSEFEIVFTNPYDHTPANFSDLFTVTLSEGNGIHLRILRNVMPLVLLLAIVCMFGLFFFPVASFILGKINFNYLSFGIMCFFWGLYMIMQISGSFLGCWITDGSVCLFIDRMTTHLFSVSLVVYFRSYLTKHISRTVSGIMTVCVTIAVMVSAVLHIFAVSDMVVTGAYVNIIMGLTAAVFIILLSSEMKSSRTALLSMIMWTPMIIGLILDILNQFISFSSLHFFTYGLAATMLAQIVQIIFDLRKQRLEAVRYQQIQKELYEAKVSVMVSQIRPHFMYNALSSIAMLCKIKPDTAYEATIKFSDYLRGNMDSLKQTAPVPFKKELEHLEKYLYIEKLRFGKKLNIEYDIQADSFEIPLLSVQPLVENAVKHGVGMKEDGGTVTIATKETDDSFEIVISDDGVGFDVNEVKDDGRSHVGMENTKRRLKEMCGADIDITSAIGEGTTARIIIPKVKEETE